MSYSFSLMPKKYQPHGHINFSKVYKYDINKFDSCKACCRKIEACCCKIETCCCKIEFLDDINPKTIHDITI